MSRSTFDVAGKRVELAELQKRAAAPDLWEDSATAQQVMGDMSGIESDLRSFDDFAAGSVDATLWPLLGTSVTFELRPTTAAVSATNPKWTGNILISQAAVGGCVGESAAKGLTFQTSGAFTVRRSAGGGAGGWC